MSLGLNLHAIVWGEGELDASPGRFGFLGWWEAACNSACAVRREIRLADPGFLELGLVCLGGIGKGRVPGE